MASSSTTTTRSGEEEEEGEGEERRMEEERRVFDYFVVAGLRDKAETLNPSATECGFRSPVPHAPITDICVIFPSLGETVSLSFFVST